MRKDEILTLRDRVLKGIVPKISKQRLPDLSPDSRPYPQDVDKELFWIDRLSVKGVWPHVGYGDGPAPLPGLRYEVWYFQKRETALLALLCENRPELEGLLDELSPVFTAFVEEGRYAKRYRSAEDRSSEAELIRVVEPRSMGIWRATPQNEDKLVKALETLIIDTCGRVNEVVKAVDPMGELPQRYRDEVEARDPLAELQARFNRRPK